MTKNRSMRIAVLVLALALITCCFVGTTFAKYTSSATGTGALTVAKWDVKGANDAKLANFDLAPTITDWADPTSTDRDLAVKEGKIAPGTAGAFTVALVIDAEVDASYSISFAATGTDMPPIVYSTDPEAEPSAWKNDIAQLNVTGTYQNGTSADKSVTVYWMWDFDGEDTTYGEAAAANPDAGKVTITATLNVTQLDTRS